MCNIFDLFTEIMALCACRRAIHKYKYILIRINTICLYVEYIVCQCGRRDDTRKFNY